MTSMLLPLNDLHFGQDANPPINARRTGREDDIDRYAASIKAHGLIQALCVKQQNGKWYTADGSKRLAALHLLRDRGVFPADHPVKCDDEVVGDAEEISVAANLIRAPLHEADAYETFKDLKSKGLDDARIAARFGIEQARVERMLALGNLVPVILEAWRNGEFGNNPVGCVRAFTLAKNRKEQEQVFARLKKDGRLVEHIIRGELGGNNREAQKNLATCGIDRYLAAGGALIRDLFGDNHVISDPEIAERAAKDFLMSEMERLGEEGWSWVSLAEDLPESWSWNWTRLKSESKPTKKEAAQIRRLELERDQPGGPGDEDREDEIADELAKIEQEVAGRDWNADQKAKAGAVISVGYDGAVEIAHGVVKPAAAKEPEKGSSASAGATASGKPEKKAPTLSNALHNRLSVQATLATRAALVQEPRLGLVALLAAFVAKRESWEDRRPLRVSHDGYGKSYDSKSTETFADAFKRLADLSDAELFKIAAGIASEAVHLERSAVGRLAFDKDAEPLVGAIAPELMTKALGETFDAVDYFGGAAKPIVVQAIREAINEDEARKAEKLRKTELAEYAVKNVVPTGWLPPELRPSTYTGPGGRGHA